ncbi:MAG: hypothetical protein V3V40_06470 [Nitrosomonadaceae bacterium]
MKNFEKPANLKLVIKSDPSGQKSTFIPSKEDETFKELCGELRGMKAELNHLRTENHILRVGCKRAYSIDDSQLDAFLDFAIKQL